jgi:uncharacterized NAD-dependent epimerase/dehydratase family protein
MLGRMRRIALLAEGRFAPLEAKTAIGVLRYRPGEVAAVIDSSRAGRTAQACVGVGGNVPVVAGLDEAEARAADTLLIGVAPQGGALPSLWRAIVRDALDRGWDVISGLHEFLADDPEFAGAARAGGARVLDVRRPPADRPVAARRAAALPALVTLTVGSDCNVGKMTAALELQRTLTGRGRRASFVATGQTGMMIAGAGVAVDAVAADFVAGLVEREVVEAARDADVVLVEGQGALHHPSFSGVTLGILHGCCPRAMVLCHAAGRTAMRGPGGATGPEIAPLAELVRVYEEAAGWQSEGAVVGVALNTQALDESAARAAIAEAARVTGRAACDPVRFGAEPLADAIEALVNCRMHATRA